MKKLFVVFAVLVAAAACGESTIASRAPAAGGVALAPAPNSGKAATGAPGTTDTVPNQPVPIQGTMVIKQASLTLNVASGSFDAKLMAVRALVEQEQGFISGTDAQANPDNVNDRIRSGVVTFMVPSDRFDETIDQLSTFGKVQSERISGQDVSAQYVDLQARLANEEAQRNAMLALLGKAQSVQDIIAVQTQLGQITQQIEELKGQIQYLDHNTAFSTISVSIVEAGAPATTPQPDSWGFVTALSDAAHNFVTTINYIVSGLGAIGPIVLLLGFGYLVWRRRGSPGLKRA